MGLLTVVVLLIGLLVGGSDGRVGAAESEMRAAAATYTGLLRPELRARALLDFDDPNRLDWHYIPRRRAGLALRDMNDDERRATHDLLRAGLSSRGYRKAVLIMAMEDVLRQIEEGRGQNASHRDPGLYALTLFGDPAGRGPWGWRFEGHHLSLNFTSAADGSPAEVAVTPMFFGSNPALVSAGPHAGLGVLHEEDAIARRLLDSLDPSQREAGVVLTPIPSDILLSPGVDLNRLDPDRGLACSAMTAAQRELVEALLDEWTGNLERQLAPAQAARVREAGLDRVRFLWIGTDEPEQPHYYRLSGPSFVIEFDNTQDNANHIHTVWHDRERDFGADPLGRHLREDHDGHNHHDDHDDHGH